MNHRSTSEAPQQARLGVSDVPILARVVLGILVGLCMAVLLSLYAGVKYALGSGAFDDIGVPFKQVVIGYLLAGIWTGAVLGALLPFGRTLVSRVAVSVTGAMIVYGAVDFAASGSVDPFFVTAAGVFVGGGLGVLWHRGAFR